MMDQTGLNSSLHAHSFSRTSVAVPDVEKINKKQTGGRFFKYKKNVI